jgi:hypothetical protein
MALEVLDLRAVGGSSDGRNTGILHLTIDSINGSAPNTLLAGDFLVLMHSEERQNNALNPGNGNSHILNQVATYTNSSGTTGITTDFLDFGYLRSTSSSGGRQAGGLWVLPITSSHALTNQQLSYTDVSATGGGSCPRTLRVFVIRGADNSTATISSMQASCKSSMTMMAKLVYRRWNKPTDSSWNSTDVGDEFMNVFCSTVRRRQQIDPPAAPASSINNVPAGGTEVDTLAQTWPTSGTTKGGHSEDNAAAAHTASWFFKKYTGSGAFSNMDANWSTTGSTYYGWVSTPSTQSHNGGVSMSLFFKEKSSGPVPQSVAASATIGSATVAFVEFVVSDGSTFLEGILSATASGRAAFAAPASAAASVVSSATGTVAAVTYTRAASASATIGSSTVAVVEFVVFPHSTFLEGILSATASGSASFAAPASAAASVVSSATGTVAAVTYTRTASGAATIGSATIALASFAGSATAAASVVSSATGTVGAVTYTRTASGAATIGSSTIAALAYQGTATSDASFTLPTSTVSVIYELPATSAATLVSTAVGTVAGVETPTASMTFDRPTVSFSMVFSRPASAFASVISTVTGELGQFGTGAASLSSTGSVAVTVDYSRPASSAATISASSSTSVNDLAPSVLEAVIAHVSATATRILPSQSVSISAAMVVSSGRQPVGPSDPLQKSVSVHGISATTSESQIPISISCIVVDTVSVTFGATVPVSGTVSTTASSTGGARDFVGDLEASFSSSASVGQGNGSRFFAQVVIDGVGSLGTGLTGTLPGGAVIDGIGSISAPLLNEGEAVTVVQIWNVALVELGVGTIGTTSDGSSQAILLNTVWEGGFRAQFLADHAWNGAKRTIDLETFNDSAGDAVAPSGPRWAKAYNLPTDYLRALTINGLPMQPNGGMGQNQWEIEVVSDGATPPILKRCLLSNEGTISLEYVMDIGADIGLLSPLVAHAMGLALAAHVATNFGKPPTEQAYIAQRAADALLAAKGVDGQESSPRMFSSTSLLDVRR